MSELLDVYNNNGEKSGITASRDECYKKGLLHRGVIVWFVNPNNEILVQKRACCKLCFPNMWDKSVGGIIDSGETPVVAALRETSEEIGIKISPDQLQYIGTLPEKYPVGNGVAKLFLDSFLVIGDYKIADMKMQESEVAELKYVSADWIEKHSYLNDPGNSILGDKHFDLLKEWMGNNE